MKMIPTCILWALLGMAGYSLMTLFVKFAERGLIAAAAGVFLISL